MKIVYNILGTFNSGGMERVLSNKANYLAKKGHTIIIITTDQKNRDPYFTLDPSIQCIDLNINYTEDKDKNICKKVISYYQKQRKHYHVLEQKLKQIKAEIVISMFDFDTTFLYKIKDGSKKILEIHFSRFKRIQYGRAGLLKWIDRYRSSQDLRLAEKYDRFVVLTEEDKVYWGNLFNIQVIPNANSFKVDSFALLDNKKAMAVGRYDYQKGFDDLIKVWKIVDEADQDWTLDIYGDGPLRNDLAQLIIDLNLEKKVFLREPTKDIKSIYMDHSMVLMTSRYEGLPMVLLEAQVSGLPLLAYACKCGPRDIIEGYGNGVLVEEGNVPLMAQSIIELINNTTLRKEMGKNSQKRSIAFSEDVIMQKWISLFEYLNN